MIRSKVLTAAIAAVLFGAGMARAADPVADAPAKEPTPQELMDQIKQLQAKVQQMEAKQNQNSAEVEATVQKILADAQKRSTVLPAGDQLLAGYTQGNLFIKSADGNYLLIPSFELQVRNTTNYNTADDSLQNGFDIRRMKVRLEGNAITPNLTYAFQWAMTDGTGTPNLEDAWVRYQWTPGWYVQAGQFKDYLLHEQLVSGRQQMAADRALLTVAMTGSSDNYIQGVGAIYDGKDQPWRAAVAFTDGIGSANTTWQDPPANTTDFGAVGRVEYFARGTRADYTHFTAYGDRKESLVFGGAADVTQGGDNTVWIQTLDASYQNPNGLSAYGAAIGRYNNVAAGDSYDWGLEAQGAYLFRPKWEGFVRYDFINYGDPITFTDGANENLFQEFTIGVNYYVHSYYAKFTVDATWLPDGAPANAIGLGEVVSDEAEYLLRAQFQLVL